MRGSDFIYNILVNFKLSKKICIEKLGITFRPLNKKNKDFIIKQIQEVYIKNKRVINQLTKKYNEDDDINLSMELLSYDDLTRETIMFCFIGKKSGFCFNSLNKINKLIDNMIIIDIDNDKLSEYVEEKNYIKLISNLLSLYDIYSSNIYFNDKVRFDYSYILNDNILNPKEKDYNLKLITSFIMSYDNKMVKMTELSEEYLLCLKKFFSKLYKKEIRRFLNSVDMYYSDNIMLHNRIVNNIALAESVLIREGEDIRANYVLKSGLILKHYAKGGEKINNFIRDYLNYCYDIRSAIVHGNDEKILDIYNSVIQKNKLIKELAKDSPDTYINKKMKALSLTNCMSIIVNRAIIKYWLDNPSIISYMKT